MRATVVMKPSRVHGDRIRSPFTVERGKREAPVSRLQEAAVLVAESAAHLERVREPLIKDCWRDARARPNCLCQILRHTSLVSPVRRRRYLATARRHYSERIVLEHVPHFPVDALEAILPTRREMDMAHTDAMPQQFAGVRARDVDEQGAGDPRIEVVRTVSVMGPVVISPTRPPVTPEMRLDGSMRRDVHIRMGVITPEAPRLELRSDRGTGDLPVDRTFVGPPRLRSGDIGCVLPVDR